jgi:hypothetical protein
MWILKDHLNWQLLGLIAKEASKGDRVGEVLQQAYDQAKTKRKSATHLDLLIITLTTVRTLLEQIQLVDRSTVVCVSVSFHK